MPWKEYPRLKEYYKKITVLGIIPGKYSNELVYHIVNKALHSERQYNTESEEYPDYCSRLFLSRYPIFCTVAVMNIPKEMYFE